MLFGATGLYIEIVYLGTVFQQICADSILEYLQQQDRGGLFILIKADVTLKASETGKKRYANHLPNPVRKIQCY